MDRVFKSRFWRARCRDCSFRPDSCRCDRRDKGRTRWLGTAV